MSHLPIWYLGEVPIEECDKAFSDLLAITPKDATMGKDGEAKDHLTRSTTVRFAPKDHWFGQVMLKFGNLANANCNWGWNIDNYEAIQFAEYGEGQHYHWHVDNFPLSGASIDRKVSVVCLMNDPSEFEGGVLQFRLYEEYTPELKKGSIIAFPSVVEHRVLPVTKGIRYSATMWINGPRFR
jgi:PKHD-type hydroxylase